MGRGIDSSHLSKRVFVGTIYLILVEKQYAKAINTLVRIYLCVLQMSRF